jgi:hypothetical protein
MATVRDGIFGSSMGLQDPKDVARDTARDLSGPVGELAALKGDANHWLSDSEYAALRDRLEAAHAAVEAALVEARRRARRNESKASEHRLALGCAMLHTSPRRKESRVEQEQQDRQQQWFRWPPTGRQLFWIEVFAALAFLLTVVCGYLFGWKWTGLPKQTLWDWLDLLIVPFVLAVGGYLFTRSESRRAEQSAIEQRNLDRGTTEQRTKEDRWLAHERAETDRQIADQRRQDETLQAYLDYSGELLLNKDMPLRQSKARDEVRTLAQARTLTVLRRLDGERKGRVLQFLYEAGLITRYCAVVALAGPTYVEPS